MQILTCAPSCRTQFILRPFLCGLCKLTWTVNGTWGGGGGREGALLGIDCDSCMLSEQSFEFLSFFFKVKWHNRFVFTWYSASESTLQQQTSSITARLRSRFSTTDSSSAAFTKPVNWLNFLFQRFTHRILTWVHIWVSECLFSDYYHIK